MVLHHNGIICGGEEYAPKLEKVGNTERLTFYVLFTRGGNSKKNFDIFQVKCFSSMAKKYYELVKDDQMKGKTVGLQLSLENNSNGFLYEFICTFMNTQLGEHVVVDGLPECALETKNTIKKMEVVSKKEETTTTIEEPKTEPLKNIVKMQPISVAKDDEVKMVAEKMDDSSITLLEAPIGFMKGAKTIFKNAKLVSMQGKVVGALAENPEYLIFREMMG